jgi:hypothetical protein
MTALQFSCRITQFPCPNLSEKFSLLFRRLRGEATIFSKRNPALPRLTGVNDYDQSRLSSELGLSQGRVPLCIPAALAASIAIWLSLRKTVSDWAEAAEALVGSELAI